jgi:ABC-type arginine transport system permease subunit
MTWPIVLYMVAGVVLTLAVLLLEQDDLSSFDIQLAIFAGPFVGVPVFIIMMLFFFNWGLALRTAWRFVASLWKKWRAKKATGVPQP